MRPLAGSQEGRGFRRLKMQSGIVPWRLGVQLLSNFVGGGAKAILRWARPAWHLSLLSVPPYTFSCARVALGHACAHNQLCSF
jgi:hypothetical protein